MTKSPIKLYGSGSVYGLFFKHEKYISIFKYIIKLLVLVGLSRPLGKSARVDLQPGPTHLD